MLTNPTLSLLVRNLDAAVKVGVRLCKSQTQINVAFPMTVTTLAGLTDLQERELDGLLKQVENLLDILSARVFRGILLAEDVDVAELLPRDIANRMETYGVLADATHWSMLVRLRNKLAHEYPLDPVDQAERLNAAFDAINPALAVLMAALAFVRRRFPEASTAIPDFPFVTEGVQP